MPVVAADEKSVIHTTGEGKPDKLADGDQLTNLTNNKRNPYTNSQATEHWTNNTKARKYTNEALKKRLYYYRKIQAVLSLLYFPSVVCIWWWCYSWSPDLWVLSTATSCVLTAVWTWMVYKFPYGHLQKGMRLSQATCCFGIAMFIVGTFSQISYPVMGRAYMLFRRQFYHNVRGLLLDTTPQHIGAWVSLTTWLLSALSVWFVLYNYEEFNTYVVRLRHRTKLIKSEDWRKEEAELNAEAFATYWQQGCDWYKVPHGRVWKALCGELSDNDEELNNLKRHLVIH